MRKTERVAFTTTAGETATVYSSPFVGRLAGIYADKGDTAATTDIVITSGVENAAILTITNLAANAWYFPTGAACDSAGTARLYAAAGQAVPVPLPVHGAFKVVVAQGGVTKTGYITFYVD